MKSIHMKSLGALTLLISLAVSAQETKTLPPVIVTAYSNVTQKVAESFDKTFPTSYDDKWFKADRNYLVKFLMNEQKNTALFRKSGALLYHISYGHEKDLPADTRKVIKSQYVDFNITAAVKVEQAGRTVWIVNIEDPKKFIVLRIEDGEMEEVANYDQGK